MVSCFYSCFDALKLCGLLIIFMFRCSIIMLSTIYVQQTPADIKTREGDYLFTIQIHILIKFIPNKIIPNLPKVISQTLPQIPNLRNTKHLFWNSKWNLISVYKEATSQTTTPSAVCHSKPIRTIHQGHVFRKQPKKNWTWHSKWKI
jgi:hypothetical protein